MKHQPSPPFENCEVPLLISFVTFLLVAPKLRADRELEQRGNWMWSSIQWILPFKRIKDRRIFLSTASEFEPALKTPNYTVFLWIEYDVEWPVGSLKMVHEHQVYCVSTAGKGMTLPSLKEKHPWSKITVMLWGSGEISVPRRDVGTGRPALGRGASEGPAGWWVTLRQIWEYRYGCRGWRIVNHAVLNLKSCRKRLPLTSSLILNDNEWIIFIFVHMYSGHKFLELS